MYGTSKISYFSYIDIIHKTMFVSFGKRSSTSSRPLGVLVKYDTIIKIFNHYYFQFLVAWILLIKPQKLGVLPVFVHQLLNIRPVLRLCAELRNLCCVFEELFNSRRPNPVGTVQWLLVSARFTATLLLSAHCFLHIAIVCFWNNFIAFTVVCDTDHSWMYIGFQVFAQGHLGWFL